MVMKRSGRGGGIGDLGVKFRGGMRLRKRGPPYAADPHPLE